MIILYKLGTFGCPPWDVISQLIDLDIPVLIDALSSVISKEGIAGVRPTSQYIVISTVHISIKT